MKRFTILRTGLLQVALLWLCSLSASAQVPTAMDYQVMATNPKTGQVLADKELLVKVELRLNSEDGKIVWGKEETLISSKSGICTMSLDFADVDWTLGSYFVKAFVNGEPIGASQIKSVPFALMANGVNGVITKQKLIGTWSAIDDDEKNGKTTYIFAFNQDGTFSYRRETSDYRDETFTGIWKIDKLGHVIYDNVNGPYYYKYECCKSTYSTIYDEVDSGLTIIGTDHQFYNWAFTFYKQD